jgi:hypothetical protein
VITAPFISPAERQYARAYIDGLLPLLKLSDWTLRLADEPSDDEEVNASIRPVEGRRLATITLGKDWRDLGNETKRHALVHELIHCHQFSACDIVRLDLPKHLSQCAYDILFGGFRRQVEYMTDGLTDAIAPLMPEYVTPATPPPP